MQLTALWLVFPLSVATTFFLQPSALSVAMANLVSPRRRDETVRLITRQFY